nr:alpha/beta fold hydrolase [Dietzia alimentaria]
MVERAEVIIERIAYPTRGEADPDQNWGDLYLPVGEHAEDSVPLVVLIHGGSWASQLGAAVMDDYARDLVKRGMAVYNIEYRRVGSGGGWPTTFSDVAHALDHVIEIDRQYPELTTDDELVVGHSAGAQLAMWAGTRHALEDNEVGSKPAFRPTRVISLAGPLDMTYAATHGDDRIVAVLGGPPDKVPERYTSVDPIQNIDPDVPVVAIHGTADTLVSPTNSERYIAAVKRAGGIGVLTLAGGEDHVSLVNSDSPWYGPILDIITDTSEKSVDELGDKYSG